MLDMLMSDDQLEALIPDLADRDDEDQTIKTIVVESGGENIFIQFQNEQEIKALIQNLEFLLKNGELTANLRGRLSTFGEECH
ncbi:MAG: hypothetical protein AB4042_08895 [Leptolyngbyaceae cyanobacterium]